MAQGVSPIGPGSINPADSPGVDGKTGAGGFKDVLIQSIGEVNDLQLDAEQAISSLATGKTENVTEVMAAVEKADLAFKNLMAIRNKIVDAYKEIEQLRI